MMAFLESLLEIASRFPAGEVISFVMGLMLGSFFNVCAYRLPREESIVRPGSRCRNCQSPILWWHNIPIISYLFLRGSCHSCGSRISIEYPLVELVTALGFLLLYRHHGWTKPFVTQAIFLSGLWIASIVDLHHQIIPDEISLGGIPLGLAANWWTGELTWWEPLLGIVVGGGSFFAISWIYEKLTKREGLGGGDVKLLAMIGAWLGVQSILPVIVISSAVGSCVGIAYMVVKKKGLKEAIPFGPFLAVGALAQVLWGTRILEFLFPFGILT